ncbi:hypothetical protein N7509_001163 [Penicillium cosmopolitanum]|uniref:E3 ubiquitin ligase complex SCF subunit n=1 Tax=Penicillium cosmopolitanum TaxID=1131564 RepID=A0A9W9WBW0_9EURO|nr:uncharacterized protein N7509_001163 [Penicillium cosmopolitanum]KAJ5414536.1 hypothetical protein N7509_001163 [Penicillium cosmopolitanum]
MATPQITLTSSDGVDVTVERTVAERSVLIKNMLEDLGDSGEAIPIPNVSYLHAIQKLLSTRPSSARSSSGASTTRTTPPTAGDEDDNRRKTSDIEEWDQKFMQVDQEMLFEIILVSNSDACLVATATAPAAKVKAKAKINPTQPFTNHFSSSSLQAANYLDIKALLDVGCKTVANMIKGKSPEEIRKTFNIQNDFTPEEEDQIRRENEWAEE